MTVPLRELSDDEWSALCKVAESEGLDPTDYVVHQGDDGHRLTCTEDGTVHDLSAPAF
jgi:hypothetical protein